MGGSIGFNLNRNNNLEFVFDIRNSRCYIDNNSWKFISERNLEDVEFEISNDIYDTSSGKFITDGVDDTIDLELPVDVDFPMTISMLVKATAGSYIYDDSGAISLYYTKNNKMTLMASSPSIISAIKISSIYISEDNDIILMINSTNHSQGIIKLGIDGVVKESRRLGNPAFAYVYSYGKMLYDSISKLYYLQTYRGYSKSTNFFITNNYTRVYSTSKLNTYYGDIDMDTDYLYFGGKYYDNKIHKVSKNDSDNVTDFGTGVAGNGDDQTGETRGVSVGDTYVYVSDALYHRVIVINKSDMTYHSTIGVNGVSGSGDNYFDYPCGSVIRNGKLYIADGNNDRIKVYDEITHNFIKSINSPVNFPFYLSANDDYLIVMGESGDNIAAIKLIDDAVVLNKTFPRESQGPGEWYIYSSKGIRKDSNGDVYVFERNSRNYVVNPNTLTWSDRINIGQGDTYDVAIDDNYFYFCGYDQDIKKIDRTTYSALYHLNTIGSGDGEFISPRGIAVDNNYVYVADTGNDRIQIFNKGDMTYYSKFGIHGTANDGTQFDEPNSVIIDNGKIYIGDFNNSRICVYNQTTLAHIATYPISIQPYKIRISDDELFILNSQYYYVYDKNTFTLLRNNTLDVDNSISGVTDGQNFEISGDKIFHLESYSMKVIDKNDLEIETLFDSYTKCLTLDTKITSEYMMIDIILTSDRKMKLCVNGNMSPELSFKYNVDFKTIAEATLGKIYNDYYEIELDWFGVFNNESTDKDNIRRYNYLTKRIGSMDYNIGISLNGIITHLDEDNDNSYIGEPTTNLASTEYNRTFSLHDAGAEIILSEAPEKGNGWKKIIIKKRGTNFRIAKFPYITQPISNTRTYSVEIDFNDTTNYYLRGDGFTGFGENFYDSGRYVITKVNNESQLGSLAIFLNHSSTNVSGLNDVIYYRYYQVEEKDHATTFTANNRPYIDGWLDLSGFSNHCNITNLLFERDEDMFYDASNTYGIITHDESLNCTSISVCAWVYPESTSEIVVMSKLYSAGWEFGTYNGNVHVNAKLGDTYFSHLMNSGGGVIQNAWNYITWTYDNISGASRTYVNGNLTNTIFGSGDLATNTSDIHVGKRSSSNDLYFDGYIKKIHIYNRALTQLEIKNNFTKSRELLEESSKQVKMTNLMLYLDSYNKRSYAGEPTVNINSDPLHSTRTDGENITLSIWGGDAGYGEFLRSTIGDGLMFVIHNTAEGTGGVYTQFPSEKYTLENGKTYTRSWYAKSNINQTVSGHICSCNKVSDNTYIIGGSINLTTEWQRYTHTFVYTYDTASDWQFRHINYEISTIYIANVQLEEKGYATEFVVGGRPEIDGFRDLSNKENHVNLTYATYDSSGNLDFDGSGYIDCGFVDDVQFSSDDTFTIVVWFYIKDDVNIATYGFFGNGEYQAGGWNLGVSYNKVYAWVCDDSTQYTTTHNIQADTWYQIAFKYNGASITSKLNDGEWGDSVNSSITKSNSSLLIGRGQQGGWTDITRCKLGTLMVYNTILTDAYIDDFYHRMKHRFKN